MSPVTTTDTGESQNIDFKEIAHFEKLAHSWWDPNGEFKPLHDMNPLRADYIDKHSPVKDKTLIDVGCGGGILAENLALRGAIVTGIDMGEAPLSVARLHALESTVDVNYQQTTAETIAKQQPNSFDIVCCLEMLEHVPDPASTVAACIALCKPSGSLYFSTINRNLKAWLMAIVGAEYILGLLPKGTHQYDKLIKPSEMMRWLRQHQLEDTKITGMRYNPITKTFWLDDNDVDINYLVHAKKPSVSDT